jgi:hypothetical protein
MSASTPEAKNERGVQITQEFINNENCHHFDYLKEYGY